MSNMFSGGNEGFRVKSPFRTVWYKDKSYLGLSFLAVSTISFLTWFTIYQEMNGKPELDWAGTGPKPIKRADTSLSTFRELLNEREAEEKKRRMKQSIEQKRAQKYQKNGHTHEE